MTVTSNERRSPVTATFGFSLPPNQRLDIVPIGRGQAGGCAILKFNRVVRNALDPLARETGERFGQVNASVEFFKIHFTLFAFLSTLTASSSFKSRRKA